MSASNHASRASRISALLVLLTLLILVLGAPILKTYFGALRAALGLRSAFFFAVTLVLGFFLLFVAVWRSPRFLAAGLGIVSLLLVLRSGNGLAFLTAAAILGITLLAGDSVARLIRGFEAKEGELSISIATGCMAIGVALLLLGEVGLVKALVLTLCAMLILVARRRRIPELARLVSDAARGLWAGSPSKIEAFWIATVLAVLFPAFLGALRPDLSWDALAYHLPQIRDFAEKGRVLPLPNLYPLTFLWRNYDTFLGLAFFAGGERAVRFLHLAVGLAAFGSTAALARRLGATARCPLALLALCAFPAACLQLRNTFVDLPAALFLTAGAVEIAASGQQSRRVWLGGFLFGGAVAAKVFSILGAPALAILLVRRPHNSPRRLLSFALFAAIAVIPWLVWNQCRLGFFLAPYYDPWKAERSNPLAPIYGPPTDPEAPPSLPPFDAVRFLRLPYDLTFQPSQFSRFGEYTGLLPPLLLVGLAGWGRRKSLLLCAAVLATLIPWYVASSFRWVVFSARYLIAIYPLYGVAAGLGLERLTNGFRDRLGGLAAVSIAALVLAVPIPLLSAPGDLNAAFKHLPPENVLSMLPAYPLWTHVRAQDRVLLLGDPDRYHCPAGFIVSDTLVFPTEKIDPNRWQSEWRPLGINVILHRTDGRDATALFQSLGDCLHPVASHGVATLYRVDSDRQDCAPATFGK